MKKLRNTLTRKIAKAKKLLAKWNNPITRTTLNILNSQEVEVRSFRAPHPRDLPALAKVIETDVTMQYSSPLRFSKEMSDECAGLYYQGRIYLSESLSCKNVALTLIHEVNHRLNHSDEHLETKAQIFEEEYRAAVAEHLGQNRAITRSFYRLCAQKVCEDYNVPLPKEHTPNPKPPKGVFFR